MTALIWLVIGFGLLLALIIWWLAAQDRADRRVREAMERDGK